MPLQPPSTSAHTRLRESRSRSLVSGWCATLGRALDAPEALLLRGGFGGFRFGFAFGFALALVLGRETLTGFDLTLDGFGLFLGAFLGAFLALLGSFSGAFFRLFFPRCLVPTALAIGEHLGRT